MMLTSGKQAWTKVEPYLQVRVLCVKRLVRKVIDSEAEVGKIEMMLVVTQEYICVNV